VTGGAVVGAILGAIAGGGRGAAIGAGAGSAAGAGVQIFTRGKEVKVPSETLLEFRLEKPVPVVATQS
jgi:outer membrane lipoprotein SlyB